MRRLAKGPFAVAIAFFVFGWCAGYASANANTNTSTTVEHCGFGGPPHLSAIRINLAPILGEFQAKGKSKAYLACNIAATVWATAQYDSEHGGLAIRFVDNDVVFRLPIPWLGHPTQIWTVAGQEVRRHDGGVNIVCVAGLGRQEVDFTIVGPPS
jgi:hypothetical protein